jgi:hypothetical protein
LEKESYFEDHWSTDMIVNSNIDLKTGTIQIQKFTKCSKRTQKNNLLAPVNAVFHYEEINVS